MVDKRPSVLIVDDEQVVCDVLYDYLTERGYQCATVVSGKEALAKLSEQDFDAVLLDIRLPGMSGMEVLHQIWSEHGTTATIMITAVNDVGTAVEAMKLGALDYIVKPFDLDRVDATLRTALETRKAAQKSCAEIDAIARGIEAKLDPYSDYANLVTQTTIDIARKLETPEEEIQTWAAAKEELHSERRRLMEISTKEPR